MRFIDRPIRHVRRRIMPPTRHVEMRTHCTSKRNLERLREIRATHGL